MATINLTNETFATRVADYNKKPGNWDFLGNKPAIIDFYASWCGPCKALSPVLDEVAEEYKGKVDIYKVNVDDEPELSTILGIRSIPTLLFIAKDGSTKVNVGGIPKTKLQELINQLLNK